jgi:hypothetical protein
MSVMIVIDEVYESLSGKMLSASFNKTVNENYFSCCNDLTEPVIEKYITDWAYLNDISYSAKYESGLDCPEPKLKFKYRWDISSIQFLKWLRCIRYQIEMDTIKSTMSVSAELMHSYSFLEKLIRQVESAIIGAIPEYKDALWNGIPQVSDSL